MTSPAAAETFRQATTLEVLFAQAEQQRVFLLMAAGGVGMALLLQVAGWLHRASRPAGLTADALCGIAGMALALYAGVVAGGGLRSYAALGLLTGLALYRAGLQSLAEALLRLTQKLFKPGRNAAP